MLSKKELVLQVSNNLMEISNDIIEDYSNYCHKYLIKSFGCYDTSCDDPIYWYERYKYRVIPPQKRDVIEAEDIEVINDYINPYRQIKLDISAGNSLAKYQSRKLKQLNYDDDMLSHWGIQHLHLSSEIDDDGYVKRTRELLFVLFKETKAYLIGIFDHNSWSDTDIIKVIHYNWPEELTPFKTNRGTKKKLTSQQYKALRRKNVCSNIVVDDGTEYLPPAYGVTSNGAPALAKVNSDFIIHTLNTKYNAIKENINIILDSDPQYKGSEKVTIGMEITETGSFVYQVKETGFKFTF